MNQDFARLRDRLRPVLDDAAHEPSEAARAVGEAAATLREHLAALLGAAGAHAVLVRSLAITRDEHPWLAGVEVLPASEECLSGLDAVRGDRDASEIVAAGADFLAHAVALVTVFLGEEIAMRPVRAAWPHLFEGPDGGVGEGGSPDATRMQGHR